MEPTSLRYFAELANELHFGRAAAALHITQPALSQHISRLERQLGVKLVERTTRKVSLTRTGERIAAQAFRLSETERSVSAAVAELAQGRAGDLRIGFFPSAAFGILPRLMSTYGASYSHVRVSLHELPSEDQIRRVSKGELDLGLVRDVEEAREVSVLPLADERLVLACPGDRFGASSEPVALSLMREENFVILPHRVAPAMYQKIANLCRSAGISLAGAREALAFPTTLSLIASGLGVAIVPESLQAVILPNLSFRPIADAGAYSRIALIAPAEVQDRLAQDFMDMALHHWR